MFFHSGCTHEYRNLSHSSPLLRSPSSVCFGMCDFRRMSSSVRGSTLTLCVTDISISFPPLLNLSFSTTVFYYAWHPLAAAAFDCSVSDYTSDHGSRKACSWKLAKNSWDWPQEIFSHCSNLFLQLLQAICHTVWSQQADPWTGKRRLHKFNAGSRTSQQTVRNRAIFPMSSWLKTA